MQVAVKSSWSSSPPMPCLWKTELTCISQILNIVFLICFYPEHPVRPALVFDLRSEGVRVLARPPVEAAAARGGSGGSAAVDGWIKVRKENTHYIPVELGNRRYVTRRCTIKASFRIVIFPSRQHICGKPYLLERKSEMAAWRSPLSLTPISQIGEEVN